MCSKNVIAGAKSKGILAADYGGTVRNAGMFKRMQILLLVLLFMGTWRVASAQTESLHVSIGGLGGAASEFEDAELSETPQDVRIISVSSFIGLNILANENHIGALEELISLYRSGFKLRCGSEQWDPTTLGFAKCSVALDEIIAQNNRPSPGRAAITGVGSAIKDAIRWLSQVDDLSPLKEAAVVGDGEDEEDWIPGGTGILPNLGLRLIASKLSAGYTMVKGDAIKLGDSEGYIPPRVSLDLSPALTIQDTVPSTQTIEILGDKIEVPAPDLDYPNNGIYKINFQFPKIAGSTPSNNCNIPELKFAVIGQHAFGAWEDHVWNAEISPSNNFAAVLHLKGSAPLSIIGWLNTKNFRSGGTAEHSTCGSARLSIRRLWPQANR